MYLYDNFERISENVFVCFIYMSVPFVSIRVTLNGLCCDLLSCIHLRVMNQIWQTGRNEVVLHFQVVFCSLLTSNWEVSTGRSLNSFISFIQIAQKFVISSYVENIETNLPNGKNTLRVFI